MTAYCSIVMIRRAAALTGVLDIATLEFVTYCVHRSSKTGN